MRNHKSKLFSLTAVFVFVSCETNMNLSENNHQQYDSEKVELLHPSSFVTEDQAKKTADIFMGAKDAVPLTKVVNQDGLPGDASVQTINKNGEPLMYVVNYDEGGFVIISTTRDYLPILAYSKEGKFDISSIKGGLSLWVDETMTAIETSGEKSDSVKVAMNRLWKVYEKCNQDEAITKSSNSAAYTPGEIACMERCEELFNQYSGEGWNFLPLSLAEHIFEEAGLSYYYDNLCYSAQFNHSELGSSVVGWKSGSFTETCEPLLSTYWDQDTPYNDLCNGYSAGCGAIAVAQVMKHYEYPSQISYDGNVFGWDSIPDNPTTTSNHSKLIKEIGNRINIRYWSIGSWTTPEELKEGVESFGYNVTRQDDNPHEVEHEVLHNHRPVIMLGNNNNLSALPGSAEYIGNSHYWVIDGAKSIETDVFMVFAEWQPYDCGEFTISYNSIDNPDIISGASYLYYHCNWGSGYEDSTWYAFDSNNYKYSRQNFFISPSY